MSERKLPTYTIGCRCGEVLAYDGNQVECPKCHRVYDSLGRLKKKADHPPPYKRPE